MLAYICVGMLHLCMHAHKHTNILTKALINILTLTHSHRFTRVPADSISRLQKLNELDLSGTNQ